MELSAQRISLDFSIDTARELCHIPGMFEVGAVYRRRVIVSRLLSAFVEAGGNQGVSEEKVIGVFKSWLRSDSPFERSGEFGTYRFLGYGERSAHLEMAPVAGVPRKEEPSPEREFGSGPYEVYAWC